MKGFNIPIVINVSIKYPDIIYKLNDKEKEFGLIKDYLFKVKNSYENQLNIIYQNEKYLRLLYGKLFRKVKLLLEGNCEISEMVRYILNKTSYEDKIQDRDLYNEALGKILKNNMTNIRKKYLFIFQNILFLYIIRMI
jgi:hypothetical protein